MSPALAAPSTVGDGAVTLRPIDAGVAALLVAASHDPEVTRWTQIPEGLTLLDADLISAGWAHPSDRVARFQVCLAELSPAGLVSIWFDGGGDAEVGYWLLSAARGRGVATAALRLLCAWAFDVCGLAVLQLTTLPGNAGSETVARHCGFAAAGTVERDIKGTMRTLRLWTRRRDAMVTYARA